MQKKKTTEFVWAFLQLQTNRDKDRWKYCMPKKHAVFLFISEYSYVFPIPLLSQHSVYPNHRSTLK